MSRIALALCLVFALAACQPRPAAHISPAYYHWKTRLQLSEGERLHLDSLGASKLYVRFFDVDWDEASQSPVPLAEVEIDTARLAGLDIVPTVFITNRAMLHLPLEDTDTLASLILDKIIALSNAAHLPPFQELQFDCDWTEQSAEKYFSLLRQLADGSRSTVDREPSAVHREPSTVDRPPWAVTATIRLHQVKFFEKTGVPPVERGMLMCYNMGDVEDWQTDNSILDAEEAGKYFHPDRFDDYPLPLDVALPVFRWGALFRDEALIQLLPGLQAADLRDTLRFEHLDTQRFVVKKSTYLNGIYLYSGDLLRLESASQGHLLQMAELLKKHLRHEGEFSVAFYHLDSLHLGGFPAQSLRNVIDECAGRKSW